MIIGASGAIYGLLLAYADTGPAHPTSCSGPAKCVSRSGRHRAADVGTEAGGTASATHVFGLLVSYLFLKGARIHPISEVKYRYLK